MKRKARLAEPRRRRRIGIHYDTDAFGQFSEAIARTLGTARYLVWQSGVIIFWISYNVIVPESWTFDPWGRVSCCSPSSCRCRRRMPLH
ncbi:MAG: hypothetical protein ACKOJC_00925 [Actinomycetota bacterium]